MKQIKILYFDDEAKTAKPLINSLKQFNFEVHWVSELSDFLKTLEGEETFDIIMLDIMAPILENDKKRGLFSQAELDDMKNGLDSGVILFKRLKEIDKYRTIPILIYTARNTVNIPENRGIAILRKPELSSTIVKMINQLLSR